MSLSPSRGGSNPTGIAVLIILVSACVGLVWLGLRVRAFSRAAILWSFAGLIVLNLWMSLIAARLVGRSR